MWPSGGRDQVPRPRGERACDALDVKPGGKGNRARGGGDEVGLGQSLGT